MFIFSILIKYFKLLQMRISLFRVMFYYLVTETAIAIINSKMFVTLLITCELSRNMNCIDLGMNV